MNVRQRQLQSLPGLGVTCVRKAQHRASLLLEASSLMPHNNYTNQAQRHLSLSQLSVL